MEIQPAVQWSFELLNGIKIKPFPFLSLYPDEPSEMQVDLYFLLSPQLVRENILFQIPFFKVLLSPSVERCCHVLI